MHCRPVVTMYCHDRATMLQTGIMHIYGRRRLHLQTKSNWRLYTRISLPLGTTAPILRVFCPKYQALKPDIMNARIISFVRTLTLLLVHVKFLIRFGSPVDYTCAIYIDHLFRSAPIIDTRTKLRLHGRALTRRGHYSHRLPSYHGILRLTLLYVQRQHDRVAKKAFRVNFSWLCVIGLTDQKVEFVGYTRWDKYNPASSATGVE